MLSECGGFDVLRGFCAQHEFTQADVARAVGVAPPVVHGWFSGAKRPSKLMQQALARWSGGAIAEAVWATKAERDRVSAVEPFRKPRSKRAAKSAA